jgi:hypothetical protein
MGSKDDDSLLTARVQEILKRADAGTRFPRRLGEVVELVPHRPKSSYKDERLPGTLIASVLRSAFSGMGLMLFGMFVAVMANMLPSTANKTFAILAAVICFLGGVFHLDGAAKKFGKLPATSSKDSHRRQPPLANDNHPT